MDYVWLYYEYETGKGRQIGIELSTEQNAIDSCRIWGNEGDIFYFFASLSPLED